MIFTAFFIPISEFSIFNNNVGCETFLAAFDTSNRDVGDTTLAQDTNSLKLGWLNMISKAKRIKIQTGIVQGGILYSYAIELIV